MYIKIDNISRDYGEDGQRFQALREVSLEIAKGEFICLLGPSGCGKTTLLNAIAGFEKVTSGSITIEGKEVTGPSKKNIVIFQNYGLLPWRTVEKNIGFGLEKHNLSKKEMGRKVDYYLNLVDLGRFRNRYPHQLSGGMQQRVAIARALAVEPNILLMDEPFGALDALTRIKMQDEILLLQRKQKNTIIFVTHDMEEAVFLADRIVIMTPNPAKVKSIISVPMGEQRDRTSEEFLRIRQEVFEAFEMKPRDHTEYFI